MKTIAVLLLCLPLAVGSCQDKYPDLEDGVYAEFKTNMGTFVAKLYNEKTPLTVANFIELAEGTHQMMDSSFAGKPYYNGLTFHRVMEDFMIQGGDPLANGRGGPGYTFPDEFVDDLKHDRKGILSMANGGPDMNGSQFFVTVKPTPWLNNRHSVFGEIVIGQAVVDSISVTDTDSSDKPLDVVVMEEVNIIRKGNVEVPSFTTEMEMIEQRKQEKLERLAGVAKATTEALQPFADQAEETESGLKLYWNQRGKGMKPNEGAMVLVHCTGYFTNGDLFYTTRREVAEKYEALENGNPYQPMVAQYSPQAQMIPGFREAMLMMSVGDRTTLFIPSHLGYGATGRGSVIPPNTDLIFELELVGIQ